MNLKIMTDRINLLGENPDARMAMIGVEQYVRNSTLDSKLRELVKIRASQLNGCAHCLNMHTRDARKLGETDQRMYLLNAWRETDLFTGKERAALNLTEAVTLIADGHVPDEVYNEAAKYFEKKELAALIMSIVAINSWNRIAITCESPLD